MARHFLQLSYNGANFFGWQVQPDRPSVQQTIQDALAMVLRAPVAITGAGRTDTGVHAHTMVAHVDLPEVYDDPFRREGLRRALCGLCRPDIAIQSITPVHADAHARFDATSRTYRYFVHTVEQPFLRDRSWQANPRIDFDAMREAAALLPGKRDYTSFSKLHTDTKTNICDITDARWMQMSPSTYYFEITADRFLRNMVRAIVGTLVDIGMHKFGPEHVTEVIEMQSRAAAGESMPGHALFLWDIQYPYYQTLKL